MAVQHLTAVARFRAKIRRKSIARPLMRRAGLRKTSLLREWLKNALSSLPTRLVLPSRCLSMLTGVIQEVVDLSPRGIREGLQLSRPIYARSAAYGHFGREPDADGGFSWEKTDLVDALKAAASS